MGLGVSSAQTPRAVGLAAAAAGVTLLLRSSKAARSLEPEGVQSLQPEPTISKSMAPEDFFAFFLAKLPELLLAARGMDNDEELLEALQDLEGRISNLLWRGQRAEPLSSVGEWLADKSSGGRRPWREVLAITSHREVLVKKIKLCFDAKWEDVEERFKKGGG
ncbi:unnamed protein product [Polarella glacialis]|uniref:Uncharacterized protein n=1 Tax=Polarella glacialis TaxID=89957 RepID=A0A813HQ56_POLGL|nr:unnamed protein product [Polarella glacialis]